MPSEKKASSNEAYTVTIEEAEPRYIAAMQARVTLDDVGDKLPPLMEKAWKHAKKAGLEPSDPSIVFYSPQPGEDFEKDGCDIDAGPTIGGRFWTKGVLSCAMTPKGAVAKTTHTGEYHDLKNAHDAILKWCAANNHAVEGPCWEVYGPWTEDTDTLTTDVYYLLA
ncbi:MAG: GyrI-like domain-containing protein [Micavibrio sp.]|nr:GyrI-like domain-containing protein [Micavibrio sp.]